MTVSLGCKVLYQPAIATVTLLNKIPQAYWPKTRSIYFSLMGLQVGWVQLISGAFSWA